MFELRHLSWSILLFCLNKKTPSYNTNNNTISTNAMSGESNQIPDAVMATGLRRIMAICLSAVAAAVVGFHGAYAVWSFVILMELTQVEPRFFVALFCITDFVTVLIWAGAHRYFMQKYKPQKDHHPSMKPGSVDLARTTSMQIILFVVILWLTSVSLIFDSRWTGAIAPGDGHVVQNGMDTKSGIYTIWLMILFNVVVGCLYVVANMVYIFELYLNTFLYMPSKGVEKTQ